MAGGNLRLIQGENIELTVKPNRLAYQSRKDTARDYFHWMVYVESLKMKYYLMMAADAVVFFCAFILSPVFLLALIPLIPLTLRAQFNYGDKLDDKQIWESKFVTQVHGVASAKVLD